MKTYKQWDEFPEGKDLKDFLGDKPCEIDEELFHEISCGFVAPNYVSFPTNKEGYLVEQAGEAECSFEDGYCLRRNSYMTVAKYPDNTYWYLGILPDMKGGEQ